MPSGDNRRKKKKTGFDAKRWVEARRRISESAPEIAALRREIDSLKRRLRQHMGGEDIIIRAVQDVLGRNPPELAYIPKPRPQTKKLREERALLHLTDWQGGKLTETYSVSVLDRRMRRLVDKFNTIVETRRKSARIPHLTILFGGDMIEGENIYPHQPHEIEMGVFEQSMRAIPDIATRLVLDLLRTFDKIDIHCVSGNHGRPTPKGLGSHPKTNWDRVFYEYLRACLLGPPWNPRPELQGRLKMYIADSFYSVANLWDWGCLLVHGHEIRGGFAGYPWYGSGRKAMGWIDSIPEPWTYLYFGHFHQSASAVINHRTFFATASPESGNTYAQQELAAVGHPSQRAQFFDRNEGIISDHQIYLEEPGERLPARLRAMQWLKEPK